MNNSSGDWKLVWYVFIVKQLCVTYSWLFLLSELTVLLLLCRECSRVVLGIEFHHLASDDPHKVALKETIVVAREQLANYTICHVFHILDWLLVNQWSHPTLVAMMRGEDVDRDCGLFDCLLFPQHF